MAIYGDFDKTFKQHENLSTAGAALMPVYIATNNAVRIASTYTTKAIGILQRISNSTKTGASVMVRLGAISKAICDSCVAGDLLAAGAEGLRKVTGSVSGTGGVGPIHVIGHALEGSVQTSTVIPVLLSPFSIVPTKVLAADSGTVTVP